MDFHHSSNNILDTIAMIEKYRLDIRTVTMGISLLGCMRSATKDTCTAVYDTITRRAEHLVSECEKIEWELGIPIVNKRISVTPVALIASREHELVSTDVVCSSVNIGSSRAGINMDAVRTMGEVIKQAAELTKDQGAIGCAKLVVFANAVGDNPFMAGAFHGVEEPDCVVSVGVSGPGVVDRALGSLAGASLDEVAEAIKKAAFKITRAGQLVGTMASQRLQVPFGIVDLSLAPTAELGDSVAHIMEHMGLSQVGTHGTTAALVPVSEDKGMIDAVRAGTMSVDKLEAMTAICSVGLDMVAIPGDTSAELIAGMIADEAAIGVMNHKTTAVRVIPVPGMGPGDQVDFGGLLGYAPIIPVSTVDNSEFIRRGGFIPAPVHGFRN